ncbi:MAG: glycosyltransferase family 39 protein [Clostridiaceae bacterium]
MKTLKVTKESIALTLIAILSAILSFANISLEGTSNSYYAAAVKSMTMSWKNFFFVSFDPAGFVTIDKPPLGFWFQALSAKIFGFSGWSILLPQGIAAVLSVIVIYKIVNRSFGSVAGLIASLCLAVTPVFVADARNNTCDNILVLFLLLACYALTIAAEKGRLKYLLISMVLVGLGFNVKMLQAYMVGPALYITYLLSTSTTLKKRILHLVLATIVLFSISLSWALVVDSIPASSRPYIDSSTNNTVMELIIGHNGLERLGLSGSSTSGGGNQGGVEMKNGEMPTRPDDSSNAQSDDSQTPGENNQGMPSAPSSDNNQGEMPGTPPIDGGEGMKNFGGGNQGLSGSFGAQVQAGFQRLFLKSMLADQIVWFIPLAILGFIAASIKEKLRFSLDNKRKQSLVMWFMWFLPVFIYFSFTTGLFHSYYLTMLAPPIAALTGIGIVSMWEFYKEGTWKSWFLPASLLVNGVVQLLMLFYFIDYSYIVKILMLLLIILCFGSSILLSIFNLAKKKADDSGLAEIKNLKLKKNLVILAMIGLLLTPLVGSSAVLFHSVGNLPAAGLELLSGSSSGMRNISMGGETNSGLNEFLLATKTENQKYLLVVSNSNSGAGIIISTGEAVMSLGGFSGDINAVTLDQFIEMAKKGEIRYVMAGGRGGQGGSNSSISEIMTWVKENGTAVDSSEYSSSSSNTTSDKQGFGGMDNNSLYDLKPYADSQSSN